MIKPDILKPYYSFLRKRFYLVYSWIVVDIAVILLICHQPLAQEISFEINGILEERSNVFDNRITLNLKLNGLLIDEQHMYKIDKITHAADNLGNELKKLEDYFSEQYAPDSALELSLTAPGRNATSIASINGTIAYFTPSTRTNSLVQYANLNVLKNKQLLSVEKHGANMFFLDRKAFEKYKFSSVNEFYRERKRLVEEQDLTVSELEELESLIHIFQDAFEFLEEDPNTLNFYIKDPDQQIVDIVFNDQNGEVLSYSSFSSGYIRSFNFFNAPDKDWTMTVLIANSRSIKQLPFTIRNIKLP